MGRVENSHRAIDGRVFVTEIHVVDDTSERPKYVSFLRSVLFVSNPDNLQIFKPYFRIRQHKRAVLSDIYTYIIYYLAVVLYLAIVSSLYVIAASRISG